MRYRGLAADIRKAEAMLALIARREADAAAQEGERALEAAIRDLAGATQAQGGAVKLQAIAAAAMPARREAKWPLPPLSHGSGAGWTRSRRRIAAALPACRNWSAGWTSFCRR